MSQHLTIRKFGPIDEVSIEVKDILIFIGPQASGKSTISKAIFFFKSLRDDLFFYFWGRFGDNSFDDLGLSFVKMAKQKFFNIYETVWLSSETYLEYHYGNEVRIIIRSTQDNRDIEFVINQSFEENFNNLFNQLKDFLKWQKELYAQQSSRFTESQLIQSEQSEREILFNIIKNKISEFFNDTKERDFLFLPAVRSLIAIVSKRPYNRNFSDSQEQEYNGDLNIYNFLSKASYFMKRLLDLIDEDIYSLGQYSIDSFLDETINKKDHDLERVIQLAKYTSESILKGKYNYQNNIDNIDFGNHQSVSIDFASSGQQEVVWILQLILLLIIEQRETFLVIEEPEAHLFPVAQKQIIDLIALLVNQKSNQIILTTHSPYILSSFNNLLYAYNLGQKKPEEVCRIVDRHFWIDPNRLDAYILEDGKARSIMDSEMGLMESGEIDRISDIMVDTFNQLFELEDVE